MAGTTPKYALPYPDSTDPLAEGADKVHELATQVEYQLNRVLVPTASHLVGTSPGPYMLRAGTIVVTTDVNGAGIIPIGAPSTVVTVLADPGESNSDHTVTTFDYAPARCQFVYRNAGAPVQNGAVRINFVMVTD